MKQRTTARLAGLAGLAFLLFNFPFLKIWGKEGFILGIPRFIFNIFFIWAILMVLIFLIARRDVRRVPPNRPDQ